MIAVAPRPQDLTKIAQGREADIFAWDDGTVLRLPFGRVSAESLEHENSALIAAAAAGLRVPAFHGMVTLDGRAGQVLERLDGPDLRAEGTNRPWKLRTLSLDLGRIHATMHGVKAPKGMPSLLEKYRGITRERTLEIERPFVDGIRPVLARLNDGDALTHGDFHPGNVMFHRGEAVVIDWSNAVAGPPEAEVARTLMLLDLGDLPDDVPLHARALTRVGRSLARRWYFNAYHDQRSLNATNLRDWYTVQLLDRLGKEVTPGETKTITALLKRRLE